MSKKNDIVSENIAVECTSKCTHELVKEMRDVRATTREIRDFLMNKSIPEDEKKELYKAYSLALSANKNLVSASSLQWNIEKFSK